MDASEYFATPRLEFDYEKFWVKLKAKDFLDYWEKRALAFSPLTIDGKVNTNYELLSQLKKRHDEDRDTVIAVTAQQGEGKSDAACVWGQETAKEIGCRPFDIKQDVIYDGNKQEIYDKVYGDEAKDVPIVFDEFLSYASKHKWFTSDAKYLEDVFLVSRTQNKPCFLVGPRLGDFSEQFRNQRIILNIEVLKRGKAVLFMRHKSSFLSDPWNLKGLEKMIMLHSRDFMMMGVSKKKEFYKDSGALIAGVISYPPLDRSSSMRYKALSAVAKEVKIKPPASDSGLFKEKRDLAFAQLMFNLHEEGKSFEEIAEISGYHSNSVSKLVNEFSKTRLNLVPVKESDEPEGEEKEVEGDVS
jgi:hypothetical protein